MRSGRASGVILAVFLSVTWAGFAQAEVAGDLTNRLQATLEQILDRYDLPGATAAIVVPDGTVFGSAAGLADVELKRPMTPDTRLLAASIGKTFVGAMVLALESKGQVSQSDLLSKYLGDRPWFSGLPNAEAITLGHLLRHSSGLPDHPHLPEFHAAARARIARDGGRFTPEELIGFVVGKAPLFASGKGWAYTDTGYILLGLVVEAASGRSYYEMLTERFLDPLGLGDTVPSDTPDIPDLAVGYTVADNPFGLPQRTADRAGRLLWDPAMEWTGGGLASSASDLARWGHAFFGGEAMEAPYLDRLLDGVPIAPDTAGILYGTGVAIYTDTPDGPVYGHGGWIPGYVSSLRHYADHGVTVAFQINSDVGVVDDSSDHVAELEAMLARLAIEASQ